MRPTPQIIRVIDLETTGSAPPAHGVCEIGWQDVVQEAGGRWQLGGERGALLVDPGRPIAGTQLRREWKGVEHVVTVREHDFEYGGLPYRSLSAVAREIAGTRWNGWLFFGLRNGTAK